MSEHLNAPLQVDKAATIAPGQQQAKRAARESRVIMATDFVLSTLVGAGGSAPVLEIQVRARVLGLLAADEQIAQSRVFRSIRKTLGVQVSRKGFGPGSKMVWTLPGDTPSIGGKSVEPEPIQGSGPRTGSHAKVTNGSRNVTSAEANAILGVVGRRHERESVINEPPRASSPAALKNDPHLVAAGARVDQWRAGLAKLEFQKRPPIIPPHRWNLFLGDARRFLNSPLAIRAAALGWTAAALFGLNASRGVIAVAELGLIWFLQGGVILELDSDGALIQSSASPKPYSRRPPHPAVHLPWDLECR